MKLNIYWFAVLLGLLVVAGSISPALADEVQHHSESTATIACFGTDMALSSTHGDTDVIQLCAEVLNFGEACRIPEGKVVFLIDGIPITPIEEFALEPGRDPRTGQPAGIVSVSFSVQTDLHLSNGLHTVWARYIPSNIRFHPSQSTALNNLQILDTLQYANGTTQLESDQASPHPAPNSSQITKTDETTLVEESNKPENHRFWGSIEQNFMKFPKSDIPTLVITGNPIVSGPIITNLPPPDGSAFIGLQTVQGIPTKLLAANATETLFGNSQDTGYHSGQDIHLGYWFDSQSSKSVEGGIFSIWSKSTGFNSLQETANIAIPFFDFSTGQIDGYTIAQPLTTYTNTLAVNTTPGVFVNLNNETIRTETTGHVTATLSNKMYGAEVNFRQKISNRRTLDDASYSFGLSYLTLSETIKINSNVSTFNSDSTVLDPALGLPGTPDYADISQSSIAQFDTIDATNRFLGLQAGARGKYRWGQLWVSGDGNLGIGLMQQTLDIKGHTESTTTSTVTPTTTTLLAGIPLTVSSGAPVVSTTTSSSGYGLFAQPQNSGNFTSNVFAFVPSATFKIGYDISNSVSMFGGYHVFFISDVVRPGDQINSLGIEHTNFFAQSIDVGLNVSF